MNVTVNGKLHKTADGTTLAALLADFGMTETSGIAIAVNQVVVPADHWQQGGLTEGDNVLIIQATQGG